MLLHARGGQASCSGRIDSCESPQRAIPTLNFYTQLQRHTGYRTSQRHWRGASTSSLRAAGRQSRAGQITAAAGSDPEVEGATRGELSDDMLERIDAATKVIGTMIKEVSKDVLIADLSSEEQSGEAARERELAAVRKAVQSRMATLDEAFLLTLGGFVRAASEAGDADLHSRLQLMYNEVVAEVTSQLSPEVQLLQQLTQLSDSEDRQKLLDTCTEGGDASRPPVDLSRLDTTAAQFIEDMEDKAEVPDRKLLARVCLVQEEVQNAAREAAFSSGREWRPADDQAAKLRGGVSRRAVAFLQAVMKVHTSEGRLAYLRKAFNSDWEGAAPLRSGAASAGDEKSDAVRPGRFLTALGTTQAEVTADSSTAGGGVLQRLEDVRREALQVLMEMAESAPSAS